MFSVRFGFASDNEARAALEMLRHDGGDNERLRRRLLAGRTGRCLIRDLAGRVGAVQIELTDAGLLEVLDTTPGSRRSRPVSRRV